MFKNTFLTELLWVTTCKCNFLGTFLWRCGVVVITTTQLHSTKPELTFCASSNPAYGVLEIPDGEDLSQWSRLEIRLNTFPRSTTPQKQFIIMIILIVIIILTFSHGTLKSKHCFNVISSSFMFFS